MLLPARPSASCETPPAVAASKPWPYTDPAPAMGFQPVYGSDELGTAAAQCRATAHTFGKGALTVSCQNRTAKRQRVVVPRGYLFQPDDVGMQTLVAEKETELWIEPGQDGAVTLDAFCAFSKNAVPKGKLHLTNLRAPSGALRSQGDVWRWTRPYEQQKASKSKGWFGAFRLARQAAQEQRILSKSYGIDKAKYTALQADLAKIDKDPQKYRQRPGDATLSKKAGAAPGAKQPPPAPARPVPGAKAAPPGSSLSGASPKATAPSPPVVSPPAASPAPKMTVKK